MSDRFTFEEISDVLRVEDGDLFWKVARGQASIGKKAGRLDKQGYIVLKYCKYDLRAHRVIWLLTHGAWPADQIDHIDGCRNNNHPSNLRLANHTTNQGNIGPRKGRLFKGTIKLPNGRYQAACAGKYLGSFSSEIDAAMAYDAAASAYYGAHARLNFGSVS